MAQISKNGFDLIGITMHKMKGKGVKGFLGTLMFVLPLALFCLIPYAGWAIALFCWGVLETGYIRFMRALMNDEDPSLTVVFSEVRTGWFELYLGALMVTMFLLGSALIFVPGILLIGYYSLSLFTAEHFHIESVGEALYQTAVRMDGNKTAMFSYKALFYLCYIVELLAFALVGYGVYLLWAVSPVLAVLLAILAFLLFVILWTWITEYHHAVSETFFQEVLHNYEDKESKRAKKGGKEEVAVAEEKAEVKEEKPAEAKTEAKPAAPKKPAAKKAPVKKPAAKKAAPKKPAAKKTK